MVILIKEIISIIVVCAMAVFCYTALARKYRRACSRVPEMVQTTLKNNTAIKEVTDSKKEEMIKKYKTKYWNECGLYMLIAEIFCVGMSIIGCFMDSKEVGTLILFLLVITVCILFITFFFYLRDAIFMHRNYCILKGYIKKIMKIRGRGGDIYVAKLYYYDFYKERFYLTALEVFDGSLIQGEKKEIDVMMWDTGECVKPAMIMPEEEGKREKNIRGNFRLVAVQKMKNND